MGYIKNWIVHYPKFFVFVIALITTLGIQFSSPGFLAPDDPYYHVRHAAAYNTGEIIHIPVYSTIKPGGDLYPVYHYLLSFFVRGYDGTNSNVLVVGSIIFHALLTAGIYVVFYHILYSLLRLSIPERPQRLTTVYALIGTLFLTACAMMFFFRALLQRPHLFSVIALMLAFYFTLRKKYVGLFLIGLILPGLYSTSFFILVPPGVFVVYTLINFKTRKLVAEALKLFSVTLIGLSLGLAMLPHAAHHFYNTYTVNFLTLYNSIFYGHKILEGAELYGYYFTIGGDWIWIIAFGILMSRYWERCVRHIKKLPDPTPVKSFEKGFLFFTALAFLIPMHFVVRTAEYFFPLAALAVAWHASDAFYTYTLNPSSRISSFFMNNKKIIVGLIIGILVGQTFYYATVTVDAKNHMAPHDRYKPAALYLKEHAKDSMVFIQNFGMYPQLIFYNNESWYPMGMASIFTYAYDPAYYWAHFNSSYGDIVCSEEVCTKENEEDMFVVLHDTFKAKYVLIDTAKKIGILDMLPVDAAAKRLESDKRFEKVFTDTKNPEIMIYALKAE